MKTTLPASISGVRAISGKSANIIVAPTNRYFTRELSVAIGESFAKHETAKHSSGEYVRDTVHVNSVEGFNSRVRRTIAGVFHHQPATCRPVLFP